MSPKLTLELQDIESLEQQLKIKLVIPKGSCPNGILPDGPVCPQCGGYRHRASGGTWVHFNGG